ncbi:TRAP transporter large permease subunit [Desulfovibrio sp. OttesenSCG-928-C14]|nr:TRAP transporter large permease subunit [Desulfovibrio sp. OttesenSCG-928-C14]
MSKFFITLADILQSISSRTSAFVFALGMIVMAFMPWPIFIDVSLRETVSSYLNGTNDMVEQAFLVVTFAAFAWLGAKNDHIAITFVIERLQPRSRKLLEVVTTGITLGLLSTLAVNIAIKAQERFIREEYTLDLEWPLWIFTTFAAVGAVIMCLGALAVFLRALGESLEHNSKVSTAISLLILAAIVLCPFWYKASGFELSLSAMGGIGMIFMMVLLFSGTPIGISMGAVGLLGLLCLYPNFVSAFSQSGLAPLSVASNYTYTVIPLFILMGELAFHSRLSQDIFSAANAWLGRLPGGLAMAGVAGCAGFAAVCGDSMATAVTMGSVALPEMDKKNYDTGFGCASLAAGGTLGILIPPSMGFIFYAIITEESVGRLFVAGVIPGLLLAAVFIFVVAVIAIRNPSLAPKGEKVSMRDKVAALRGVLPMLILIVFILGGILGGYFSPNEGGAMGAVGAFIYALIRRRLNWATLKASLHSTLLISGRLMLILVGVTILGYFFALTQLPQHLADFVSSLDANRYVILGAIIVSYIILGCMMNVIPMIMLTLPAIFPTVEALGFDPIWFGVLTVMLMEMGQITPPVGINVFAISSVAKNVPMQKIFKSIIPFFLGMVLVLLLLILFPGLALWLPDLLFS